MAAFPKTLTLILALAAGLPAVAQETTTPAPAADAAAQPAATGDAAATAAAPDDIGKPYVAEKFGDWDLRCVRTEDGADPCQLYQLLKEKNSGNPVSEITLVNLPEGSKVAVGATIITPLETLLLEQLNFAIDTAKPVAYPFSFCTQVGCVARLGLTAEEVEKLKKGKVASVTVVPVANPNAKVMVEVSLNGFTKALAAQKKSEEARAALVKPATDDHAPAEAAPAEAAPQ
ncbi:MAG TPA: invasion associated locus B family protein [Albidovulum sp.]|uniref:invasion associated locus B family protein n=1 Tax=Albidovulum sp. TaxID=1872424 RepID=UPI002CA8C029|nr:invasion associated locus B family protein [Albidovulum sp.]